MSENTITPKKGESNPKLEEIERLQKAMAILDLQPIDISRKTGISKRTIENYIYENNQIGGKLLRSLFLDLGISSDWLLFGNGAMLAKIEPVIAEEKQSYTSDNPRINRMINFLKDWESYSTPDEQAWLEMEFKLNIKPYKEYLDEQRD